MQKNVANQRIGVQMVSANDGSAFTGSVTVYVTGDAGTQAIGSVGSGACTHEGNGYHSYAPDQAETNYDLIAFTFVGSGAVPVTVQVYTAINPVTAVPTAAANATAVRSELATELARIDVATSTRLASASYTAPDNASVTAIKAKTDNLPSDPADASVIAASFTEIKGAGWSSSTDTLEKIAESSGGGGTSIMVTPVVAQTPVRVVGSNIETFIGDLSDIRVGVFSGTDPVDLSTMGDLEVCVQLKSGVDLDLVPMADITIDGADSNYFSWTPNGESVDAVRTGKWSLRKASNKQVIAYGAWIVVDAALSDAL